MMPDLPNMPPSLVEKSHQAGAEFDYIVGDAAYSSRDNLIYAASQGCKLVAVNLKRIITLRKEKTG